MLNKKYSIGILAVRMKKGYGVDVVVDIQATVLSQRGYHVIVYTIDYDKEYYQERPYKIVELPGASLKVVTYLKNRGHDIIIAHTTPFFETIPLIAQKVVTICYEHGDPTPIFFPEDEQPVRQRIKDNKVIHVYPGTHKVLAISRFIAGDIGWKGASVIYNGSDHLTRYTKDLDSDKIIDSKEAFSEKYGLDASRRFILCVSRLGRGEGNYKGVYDFVDFTKCFKHKEKYVFIVLGKGKVSDKEELEQHGITVLLNADKEELVSAYKSCDVFISCSKWEGFNLPLVEAQSFGKPSFAIDCACHREVTQNVYESYRDIADKIEELSDDALIETGKNSKAFISDYTWEKNVDQLEKIICDTIQERERSENRKFSIKEFSGDLLYRLYFVLYNNLRQYPILKKLYGLSVHQYLVCKAKINYWKLKIEERKKVPSEVQVLKEKLVPDDRPPIGKNTIYQKGLVSICILTKDKLDLIKPCIESIQKHTDSEKIEILIGDTGSTDGEVLDYYKTLSGNIRIFYYNHYNFSENNNTLSLQANGEYLLLLNNDTCVTKGWLQGLLAPLKFDNVAITGPKLLFRNNFIQHAGVEVFTREPYRYVGWHPYANFPEDHPETIFLKSMPAVTGACMMIRHQIYDSFGGLDTSYQEECQDIDLCLNATARGYRIIYTPQTCIYHYENQTRTVKESGRDRALFKQKWQNYIDASIFSRFSQSEPWHPAVCLHLNGNKDKDIQKIEYFRNLSASVPNPILTIKADKIETAKEFSESIGEYNARCLPSDYEDNVRYDQIL